MGKFLTHCVPPTCDTSSWSTGKEDVKVLRGHSWMEHQVRPHAHACNLMANSFGSTLTGHSRCSFSETESGGGVAEVFWSAWRTHEGLSPERLHVAGPGSAQLLTKSFLTPRWRRRLVP